MVETSRGRRAADLVADLRAYGLSISEIARELDRSPRMVRKIVRGETSGQAYVATLAELVDTGQARTRPARRRGRDGQLVRVRAPRGAEAPTRLPSDGTEPEQRDHDLGQEGRPDSERGARGRGRAPRAGRAAETPVGRGGFSDSTTYLPGGVRQHLVTGPKSEGTGRERARQRIQDILRSAARGQGAGRKSVRFRVSLTDGTTVEVGAKGGYAVSAALARSRNEGNDPFAWLTGEIVNRKYLQKLLERDGLDIVGVEATIF